MAAGHRSLVGTDPQRAPGRTSSPGRASTAAGLEHAVGDHRRAVHEQVAHALGLVGGEALGTGREVAHPAQRAGRDGGRIEHHDVGAAPSRTHAAVGEAEQVGLHLGELVDGVLEREHAHVAHPLAQQVGGQRGVAQLADVGAGVGQAERAAVGSWRSMATPSRSSLASDGLHPQRQRRARRRRGRADSRTGRRRARRRGRRGAAPISSGCAVDSMIS